MAGIPAVRGYFGDTGPATAAQLSNPARLAIDPKGNYYIADYSTAAIRKVDTSGNINLIAGNGSLGYAGDGHSATDSATTIGQVHGLFANAAGDVFFADMSNNAVRKITASTGIISTIAGTGIAGYSGDGAAATKAQLSYPINVVLDSGGNVYFTDYYNNCIRQIDSTGNISTIAGNPNSRGYAGDGGPASKALLSDPYALAIDSADNLYFSEIQNQAIRKIDKSGNISTVVSNVSTESIAVDASGAIYYIDYPASAVRKALPGGGARILIAGTPGVPGFSGDSGPAELAQLNQPNGIAIDSAGNLLIADSSNYVIRKLTPNPFSVLAATNAASNLQGPVAPGEIVTIYGAGIGPSTLTPYHVTSGFFDKLVANTQVYVSGLIAPIVYVSATQAAIVIPYGLIGPYADITVVYQGQISSTSRSLLAAAAPGIFTANSTGRGQAAAVNGDGTLNSSSQPVKVGSYISFYITGDGMTTPANQDGAIVGTTLPYTILPVMATIGGKPAVVSYSGGAPGNVAGLSQVNVQIPAGISTGSAVPVVITVGGVASQTATIAISN